MPVAIKETWVKWATRLWFIVIALTIIIPSYLAMGVMAKECCSTVTVRQEPAYSSLKHSHQGGISDPDDGWTETYNTNNKIWYGRAD